MTAVTSGYKMSGAVLEAAGSELSNVDMTSVFWMLIF